METNEKLPVADEAEVKGPKAAEAVADDENVDFDDFVDPSDYEDPEGVFDDEAGESPGAERPEAPEETAASEEPETAAAEEPQEAADTADGETETEEPQETTELAEKDPPLFSTRVKLTDMMTVEYAKHVYLSRKSSRMTLILLTGTCFIGAAAFLFKGIFGIAVFLVLFGIGYPLALIKYTTGLGRKEYYEHYDYNQVPIYYDFYEDYFVMTDAEGPLRMRYEELDSIQQTNNLFLLMVTPDQGGIIPKMPGQERLQQFLADKEAELKMRK